MKKSILYAILLVGFSIALINYLGYVRKMEMNYAESSNYKNYNNFSKAYLIKNIDEGKMYVAKDKASEDFYAYKINKYLGKEHYQLLSIKLEGDSETGDYFYPTNSYPDNLSYTDTIQSIHIDDLRTQIYESEYVNVYEEVKESNVNEGDELFFEMIDNSFLIFFVIALLCMIGLYVLELPIYLISRYFNADSRIWIYGIALIGFIRFYQTLIAPGLWPYVQIEILLRPMIMLLPVFIIYQWVNSRLNNTIDFLDQQLVKFLIIFFMIVLGVYLADRFSLYVAATEKRGVLMSNYTWTIAMAYAFALGNLLFNLTRHAWSLRGADKKLAIAQKEALTSESKLQSIQSSVNPHFLYNALNSISSLAIIDPSRTQKMTMALSEFYRYHTNRDQQNITSMKEEVAMLEKYIEIEKIRFEDRLQYHASVEIDDAIEIPHFLLQPLVENAIKHGYDSETNKIVVELKIWRSTDQLFISVADSGKDFNLNLNMGYGLKSVSQKLALLYPGKHELAILNEPHKHVLITIDLIK